MHYQCKQSVWHLTFHKFTLTTFGKLYEGRVWPEHRVLLPSLTRTGISQE